LTNIQKLEKLHLRLNHIQRIEINPADSVECVDNSYLYKLEEIHERLTESE